MNLSIQSLIAFQRSRDKITDTRKKVDALSGVKRLERLKRLVVAFDGEEKTADIDIVEQARVGKQHKYGMIGAKAAAHCFLDGRYARFQVRCGEQL